MQYAQMGYNEYRARFVQNIQIVDRGIKMYYSRSKNQKGEKEELSAHLELVSSLAGEFAKVFGEQAAGEWCGLYHDAGKASKRFQNVLEQKEHGINHESAGAYILERGIRSRLLAVVVYAHHKGLKWYIGEELDKSFIEEGSCEFRQAGRRFSVSGKEQYQEVLRFYKEEVKSLRQSPILMNYCDSFFKNLPKMLHARMLLSCLCDADYLASESHTNKAVLDQIDSPMPDFVKILQSLEEYREKIKISSTADPVVNEVREIVFQDCVGAARNQPGLFALTAPTGTGKTLALLSFALHHAIYNNRELQKFRRIIVVLPFLTIIDQSVKIYKDICADVLRADSTTKYTEETKLMAERWCAPLIVTTSVKFFEVLFQSRPADLRFLHSIAGSIIMFDEAQNIPVHLAGTTIESTKALCEMFGCTVVFSTATQPDYSMRNDIHIQCFDIIKEPQKLYDEVKRVKVNWEIERKVPLAIIAERMQGLSSVCCIVNRKDHAYKLFKELQKNSNEEECFYISTDLCKAHRDQVIGEITQRLRRKEPCRVVSTSCIEAGIDLDFSDMFRALAPLDSIIQCAGRCNRNGSKVGKMTVFIPDEERLYPSKEYEIRAVCVKILADRHEIDIHNLAHTKEYYAEVFAKFNKDSDPLEQAIANMDFEQVEKEYRLIKNTGANVLVPYEKEMILFEELRQEAITKGISRAWMQKASSITVTSYQEELLYDVCEKAFVRGNDGKLQKTENWYILNDMKFYHNDDVGLHFDEDSQLDYIL